MRYEPAESDRNSGTEKKRMGGEMKTETEAGRVVEGWAKVLRAQGVAGQTAMLCLSGAIGPAEPFSTEL